MEDDVDFSACRFDFRIDSQKGLTPAKRKKSEKRPVNYNTLFKCKVCGSLFDSRAALLAHKMEHTSFKCDVCGDSFQRKSIWRLHMSKVHSINPTEKKKSKESDMPMLVPPPPPMPAAAPVPPMPQNAVVSSSYPNVPGFVCINVPIFITSGEGSNTTVTAMPPASSQPTPVTSEPAPAPFQSGPAVPVPPLVPPPPPFAERTTLEPGEVKKPFTAPTPSMAYPMVKPMDPSSLEHISPINRDLHKGPPSFKEVFRNFFRGQQHEPAMDVKHHEVAKKKAMEAEVDSYVIDLSVKRKAAEEDIDDEKEVMQEEYKNPSKKKKKTAGGLSKMVAKLWENRITSKQDSSEQSKPSAPAIHSRKKSVPRSLSASPVVSTVAPELPEYPPPPDYASVVQRAMDKCMENFTFPSGDTPQPSASVVAPPEPAPANLDDKNGAKNSFCTLKFHACPTCKQLFSNSEEMRIHQRAEHSAVKRVRNRGPRAGKKLECPSCPFASSSVFRMKHHQVTVHPNGTSEWSSKGKDAESKSPTKIKCRFPGCNRVFRELRQLRVHQTLHTCEKPLLCTLCDYTCRNKSSLAWHMKNKHATEDSQLVSEIKTEIKEEVDTDIQDSEDFREPSPPEEKPQRKGELSFYRIEASPGPDPKFFTSVMKFNFAKNQKSQACTSSEDNKQKVVCKDCCQSFETAEDMWQHKMDEHADQLQFLCDSCEYRTPSRMELQSHMLSTHGNEVGDMKEFLCFICSKGYSSRRGLNNHLMRHSEEGPPGYDCQMDGCKSRLGSKSALKNHMRRVHAKKADPEVEAMFYCDFDGCDKAFKEGKHLKVHRMQHTDERPLKCDLCFYSCRQRNSMNWHMKSKHGMDKHVTPDGKTIYLGCGMEEGDFCQP